MQDECPPKKLSRGAPIAVEKLGYRPLAVMPPDDCTRCNSSGDQSSLTGEWGAGKFYVILMFNETSENLSPVERAGAFTKQTR